jgi:hypothetical protein
MAGYFSPDGASIGERLLGAPLTFEQEEYRHVNDFQVEPR